MDGYASKDPNCGIDGVLLLVNEMGLSKKAVKKCLEENGGDIVKSLKCLGDSAGRGAKYFDDCRQGY
jgi:hypothetical protein